MPKKSARPKIPAKIADQVKKEFSHLCAACGARNPQLHHIDLDHSNNDPLNLIPLCPNHHLTDAHNPTSPIEPGLIRLLRLYRDPTVLSPKCLPLYERLQAVLETIDDAMCAIRDGAAKREQQELLSRSVPAVPSAGKTRATSVTIRLKTGCGEEDLIEVFISAADQLVRFVTFLAMGQFYSVEIMRAINAAFDLPVFPLNRRRGLLEYDGNPILLTRLHSLRNDIERHVMEQLRFQDWTPPS